MAPSLISRPDRGLNLSNKNGESEQNADEETGDRLIKSTFDLLERGEKEIILDNRHKDVILILGNTGSGKSTFTQWVAGDNSKLISKETEEGTGEYIIEDHNRIGNTTLKSKTVFPELVVDATKTNAAYYDCPGFSDTQGTSHDIATTYFIKKVVDFSESLKMVFIINHSSVRKGVDRQDFMKLLRHATDLVKDIEKFKLSIAIVATKVDNQYIKKGKDFVLVEDDKVLVAIAHFLQEAKQYLEDDSKRPNISEKDIKFYKNAIKLLDVLLEKEGEIYPRIGIFRRPDMPGPISDIPLLQKGKQDIERIVYEKLSFAAKTNEDFGYTVSERTKNDINELVEEINKNLWSSLSDISGNIQEYYGNLVQQVRDKIHLFVSDAKTVYVNLSDAEDFKNKFSSGYNITIENVNKMKNLTNTEELIVIVNNTISNLDIDVPEHDIVHIANQGKYFTFLQTISDKVLSSRSWDQAFIDVETFLASSETAILHDVSSAAEKINNRIQTSLDDTVKAMQDEYTEKIKSFEMQKLPEKLSRDSRFILDSTHEMRNGTTTEKLLNIFRYIADNLKVSLPKENLQNFRNQGKYIRFLEIISNQTSIEETKTWLSPFENIARYFNESEKWYRFLENLYNKFSEYDIQKERQRYNVADLEDWGQPDKPQGISVTFNTFEKFLSKIGSYNVAEYETVKNLSTTSLQVEELNQVLSITLKHRSTVQCLESNITVKGSFISLNETMQNLMSNSDTNNGCNNFKTQLAAGKYNLFKIFALKTIFIDTDLPFAGKGLSVATIAPKWEVVGSRSIELHGADGAPLAESKAKNGAHPGSDGVKGAPGNPARSGESFFGIGSAFVNGTNLKISSNGGRGGRGQEGGNGAAAVPGLNARTPSSSDPPCENGHVAGYECEPVKIPDKKGGGGMVIFAFVQPDIMGSWTTKRFKIFGLPGGRAGNGGDGGKGGKGGEPGTISILALDQPSEETKLTAKGEDGDIGEAGSGSGQGGKNGDDVIAQWSHYQYNSFGKLFGLQDRRDWAWKETIKNNGRGLAGKNGDDGVNAVGLQNPIAANGIPRPLNIINEYKIYLRENLNNRFKKQSLLQFLDQINSKDDVRRLYDTLGLTDEFQGIEEQFHKLSDQMDFSLFYSSLLERISELAKRFKGGSDSDENKKVLNYLYSAILGRLYNLKDNSKSSLIIDIRGYLNLIKENIKTLKDLQTANNKVDVISKYKENYKKGIVKKIEEARSLIKKQINPEIENINSKIDDQLNALIAETISLQKQAEKDLEKLKEKKKELENSMATKGLFSFFQIIGGIVSFLGPVGAIAGTVIEVTSTVGESLALNNQHQIFNLPPDVVSAITSISDQIKEMRNKKVAYLNKVLDDVSKEIRKNPEKLSDMAGKIDDIKHKLKKASEKKMDFKQVKLLESELERELERKGADLKSHVGDKKSIDALKVIAKMTQIAQFGSLLHNVFDKVKEDQEKMDVVTDAMENVADKIRKLNEYEENIYDTIIPMMEEMEDQMTAVNKTLGSKSQVALDVTKWQVQSALKDMRLQMERLTEGFEVKGDLSRSIEKLEEVMTTLMDIYDRIQNYQDQQTLVNYITDISSVAASSINFTNQQLENATNHLEFSIRANIVLEQYKSAMGAFKQWVFPFADHYIEKPMLPSQLELDSSIENLVQSATREIETIKQKLDLYDTSVRNGDQYLKCEEFSNRYDSSKPFFEWKNEEYKSSLSDLLSGKEVVLKSDIEQSAPHKDAIKFSEIEFDFKLKNEAAQSLLDKTLKAFDIRATHLGNSYYRYEDQISLIISDSITISYSFEKNDNGQPIRSNEVYNKLLSGDLLLSPYTLWEVKLINKPSKHKYSFQDLEDFKNEINVELSGVGSYVDTDVSGPITHKFFLVHNNTNPISLNYKATGLKQCRRYKYRLVRSPVETAIDIDYVTNGAPKGMSSPINFLSNFMKGYFITNVITSMNQIFGGGDIPIRKHGDFPELSYECAETRNNDPNLASNPTKTDAQKTVKTSTEDDGIKERTQPKSDTLFNLNFDGYDSCSKSFLLSDQNHKNTFHSTQAPDLNCSLLLADLVTRTVTGNRYKPPIDECLLSPPEVISGKISDGMVRSESDAKHMLQRYLSEAEEEMSNSMFSKLKVYAKSMIQFLGFVRNGESEEYVEDVRNLFA